jgi:hypothetical protein
MGHGVKLASFVHSGNLPKQRISKKRRADLSVTELGVARALEHHVSRAGVADAVGKPKVVVL